MLTALHIATHTHRYQQKHSYAHTQILTQAYAHAQIICTRTDPNRSYAHAQIPTDHMHTHRSQQIICTRTDPNRSYAHAQIPTDHMHTHRSQLMYMPFHTHISQHKHNYANAHKHIHTHRSQYKHIPLFLFSSLPTPLSLSTPPSLELPLVYLGGGATLQRGSVRAGREDVETLITAVPGRWSHTVLYDTRCAPELHVNIAGSDVMGAVHDAVEGTPHTSLSTDSWRSCQHALCTSHTKNACVT